MWGPAMAMRKHGQFEVFKSFPIYNGLMDDQYQTKVVSTIESLTCVIYGA